MATLSDDLTDELCAALNREPLPPGFAHRIAEALEEYRRLPQDKQQWAQRREAVARLVKSGSALSKAMTRANTVFGEKRFGRHHIGSFWQAAHDPVTQMTDELERWLSLHAEKRKRGNPHDGHYELRTSIFFALTEAEIPISKNADGQAARVLRLVLEAADHRRGDGRIRFRANFNGRQWAYWVELYRYLERMAEARPVSTAALIEWVEQHPLPRRSRRRR